MLLVLPLPYAIRTDGEHNSAYLAVNYSKDQATMTLPKHSGTIYGHVVRLFPALDRDRWRYGYHLRVADEYAAPIDAERAVARCAVSSIASGSISMLSMTGNFALPLI